jgi:hypothetical protein
VSIVLCALDTPFRGEYLIIKVVCHSPAPRTLARLMGV